MNLLKELEKALIQSHSSPTVDALSCLQVFEKWLREQPEKVNEWFFNRVEQVSVTPQMLADKVSLVVSEDPTYVEPKREELTCYSCGSNQTCPFRWDSYNTNGDCLADK